MPRQRPEQPKPCVRVLCLGPKKRAHYFVSRDPRCHRICAACRLMQRNLALMAVSEPMRVTT